MGPCIENTEKATDQKSLREDECHEKFNHRSPSFPAQSSALLSFPFLSM